MEYPFAQLVSTKITRLLRPRVSLATNLEQSIIPSTSETLSQTTDDLSCCYNDFSEGYSGFDGMLIFPTKFGYVL